MENGNPMTLVPVVCSWCVPPRVIRHEEWPTAARLGITHGLCPDCAERLAGELGAELVDRVLSTRVTVFTPRRHPHGVRCCIP